MDRICTALSVNGYQVTLVGRKLKSSLPFINHVYCGKRLTCWFNAGFLFYAEYNLRLFFWLLFQSCDILCACDLDTALAVRMAASLRRKKSVLDAHEYFTEVPEISSRPGVKKFWEWIGWMTIPKFHLRYTVGEKLANLMSEKYKVPFYLVRNIAPSYPFIAGANDIIERERIILYQGALNVGRGLDQLLEAMKQLPGWKLWLAGEGDISNGLKDYAQHGLADRIKFFGWVKPGDLPMLMSEAKIGINLRDKGSLNDYYSLPNKFFDCLHAGLPSINMNYPEYQHIVEQYPCALLLENLDVNEIVRAVNSLDENPDMLVSMLKACREAAREFTWEKESARLIKLYEDLIKN
jgi:glycosyltransferase involved in cell wall biosynthesis